MTLQEAQATINRQNNQISSLKEDVRFWKNQGDYWMGESSRWRDLASDFRKRLEIEQDFSKASTPKKLMMREGNVIFMNNISYTR